MRGRPRSTLFPYTTLFRSDVARRQDVPAFLHVSTDEVYGSIKEGSFREGDPYHPGSPYAASKARSEEHTSELQSHLNLVCRLLLEKKKKKQRAERDTDRPY